MNTGYNFLNILKINKQIKLKNEKNQVNIQVFLSIFYQVNRSMWIINN